MAGGTGGHIVPALTVAGVLRQRGVQIDWLGTRQGMEQQLVQHYPLHTIPFSGLRGSGLWGWLQAPWRFLWAFIVAFCLLQRLRPALVLGMGGFASAPGGIAAKLLGIPLAIHEQNALAGTVNRLLAPLANHVMHAFPGTFPPSARVRHTGNPIREAITQLRSETGAAQAPHSPPHLLILGGSQGAASLNRLLPEALAQIKSMRPLVHHQTGAAHLETARAHYRQHGVQAKLWHFSKDIAQQYQWADLILCRAGAMTISELSAVGIASILIPFPHAVDDHQTANARYLSTQGAAVLLQENTLNAQTLAKVIATLCASRSRLLTMGQRAHSLYQAHAAKRIAAQCQEYLHA